MCKTPRGNLPVNWPKLLGPFQNSFTTFCDVYNVRSVMLHHFLYKEVVYYFFSCVLEQFNAVEST